MGLETSNRKCPALFLRCPRVGFEGLPACCLEESVVMTLKKKRIVGALGGIGGAVWALLSDDFADWQEWYHYAGAIIFGIIFGVLVGGRSGQ